MQRDRRRLEHDRRAVGDGIGHADELGPVREEVVPEAGSGVGRQGRSLGEILAERIVPLAAVRAGGVYLFHRTAGKIFLQYDALAGLKVFHAAAGLDDLAHQLVPHEGARHAGQGGEGDLRMGVDEKQGHVRAADSGKPVLHAHPVVAGERPVGQFGVADG